MGVYGDRVRLTQIVVNLVNNAVKYTPDGGVIEIETAREGDEIVCRVRDNGVGLPPDARVFDLFAQIESSEHMSEGGSELVWRSCASSWRCTAEVSTPKAQVSNSAANS